MASTRKVHEMKIIWEDDISVTDTGCYEEKLRVLPKGDEPMTLWLLVQTRCSTTNAPLSNSLIIHTVISQSKCHILVSWMYLDSLSRLKN